MRRTQANGPGLRAAVWVQGCTLGCPGCFNAQTHAHQARTLVDPTQLAGDLLRDPAIEGLSILGGEPFQQAAASALLADVTLSFVAIDLSGYYFISLSPTWEVGLRAGLSRTGTTIEASVLESEEERSTGVHAAVDVDWIFGDSASLMIQMYFRSYGVGFKSVEDNKELAASGLLFGVRWR